MNKAIIREWNIDNINVEIVNINALILSVRAPMQTSTDLWISTFLKVFCLCLFNIVWLNDFFSRKFLNILI